MKPPPTTKREPKDPKGKYEKPISLWPLSPDEAIGALLKVPPPHEETTKKNQGNRNGQ